MDIIAQNTTDIEVSVTAQNSETNVSVNTNQETQVVEVKVDADAAAMAEAAIIRAENVLNQTINLISGIDNRNTILFDAGYTKTDTHFTALANTIWNIGGVEFSNTTAYNFPISLSEANKQRWVRFYLNRDNEVVMLNGEERTENPPLPVLPDNTLGYTFFIVTDTIIGEPEAPILGDVFKEKQESGFIDFYSAGTVTSIAVNSVQSHIRLYNATELQSLYLRPNANVYPGKQFVITNNRNVVIPIPHNASGTNVHTPFLFPNNTTYSLKPKETIVFYLDNNKLKFLSSNMTVANTNVRTIVLDNNADGSVFTQGVTGNILLKSYPIGKLKNNAVYRISLKMTKTGNEALFTTYLELGGKSNFPLNIVNSGNASNLYVGITRDMKTFTDNLGGLKASSFTTSGSYYTDIIANVSKPRIENVDANYDYSFNLKVSTTSLTDIIQLDSLMITEYTL